MSTMTVVSQVESGTLLLNSNLHTGCPDRCGLRNGALTEMFLDFRGPQRLP